jgi:hypothetical protein
VKKKEKTEEISRSRRLFGFSVSPFKVLKGQTVTATESVFYQRLPSTKKFGWLQGVPKKYDATEKSSAV